MSEALIVFVLLVTCVLCTAGIALWVDVHFWMKAHPVKVSNFKRRLRLFFGRREKKIELPGDCQKCPKRAKCFGDEAGTGESRKTQKLWHKNRVRKNAAKNTKKN